MSIAPIPKWYLRKKKMHNIPHTPQKLGIFYATLPRKFVFVKWWFFSWQMLLFEVYGWHKGASHFGSVHRGDVWAPSFKMQNKKARKQPEATGLARAARDNFQEYNFQVSTGQGSAMNAATPHLVSAWVVKHKFIKKRTDDVQSTSCHKWFDILFNPLKYDKKIPCQTSCQILKV